MALRFWIWRGILILLILAWLGAWYIAWFQHDDCLDALSKTSGESAFHAQFVPICAAYDAQLHFWNTWGFAVFGGAATLSWIMIGRLQRRAARSTD
ncbi:MAG: hypothetical protein V4597_18080 [Pseudomonadota bacterium]